eukprot:1705198-Rhodomonas_salina.1
MRFAKSARAHLRQERTRPHLRQDTLRVLRLHEQGHEGVAAELVAAGHGAVQLLCADRSDAEVEGGEEQRQYCAR